MGSLSKLNPFIDYIADDKSEEKLKELFDFYDVDGNGLIQRQELIDVLSLCAHEIGLEVDEAHLEQLADAVFSEAKLTQAGSITFDGLKDVLKARPCLTSELSLLRSSSTDSQQQHPHRNRNHNHHHQQQQQQQHKDPNRKRGLCTVGGGAGDYERTIRGDDSDEPWPEPTTTSRTTSMRMRTTRACEYLADRWECGVSWTARYVPLANKLRWEYISNNLVRVNFFLAICLVSLALIVSRVVHYWDCGPLVVVARVGGQCLNFLCSIIVLLVCRRSITLLRSRGFTRYLPLDDHIYFHKMLGLFIVFWSLVHTLGHLANFYLLASDPKSPYSYLEYLFTTRPQIGWLAHCACITGWLLIIILAIMSLGQPFARSLGKFELFYYSHLLFVPFWALLLVHAPHFWCWFLGPFLVFAAESLVRLKNFLWYLSAEQTTIIKATPLPSQVIHLAIKRPANFDYNPGDWIYVLIPQIAKYEWHPFTISSAPEQEGVIWLHIRAVGEWTRSLRSYFDGLEHRDHLRKFIKSGQFSISIDHFNGPTAAPHGSLMHSLDMSLTDSTRYLGATSRARSAAAASNKDKLTQFKRKASALAPIPETDSSSCETATTDLSSSLATVQQQRSQSAGQQLAYVSAESSLSSDTSAVSSSFSTSSSSSSSSSMSTTSSTTTTTTTTTSTTSQRINRMPNIKIFIDGPYGSPSSQIFRAEHAVLIATGIGVTPFASILQSIVHHYEKRRQKCPNCAHEFSDTRPPIVCKLRKVDFVWINRDQKSFEWFIKLLAELELTQSQLSPNERFLDIHIHLTAIEPEKTKSIGLQLALYLVHEKNKKDLVTGLRTRTKAGRPNWDRFFRDIQDQSRGKVSVFFCGRPQLGRTLHRHCDSFGFKFRKEIF